ncbi:MAG: DJ-1/PfpI family protein [Treponema sp.]|nr:DJ-1/PfpI family protein [Treponema sp.]
MQKKVLTFLAEGFEEVEAVTPIDYLRRAGITVTIAAITAEKMVRGAHNITIAADTTIADLEQSEQLNAASWDGVFVPGGMPGASNLAACAAAGNFYKAMNAAGKTVAAICASPAVFLAPLGLLEGKKFTCYPGMEKNAVGGKWLAEKTVVDGNLVTGSGPGTAVTFAVTLVEIFAGKDAAKNLSQSALL